MIASGGSLNTSFYNPIGDFDLNTTYYWRVDVVGGGATTTGNVWSFTTRTTPGQATNPGPANGASGVALDRNLTWSGVAGADSYRVYLGTQSNSLALVASPTVSSYNPANDFAAGVTYYWRVDVVGGGGTTTGNVWSFTVVVSPNLPQQASNPFPADGATNVPVASTLTWTAIGADKIYLGTDQNNLPLIADLNLNSYDLSLIDPSVNNDVLLAHRYEKSRRHHYRRRLELHHGSDGFAAAAGGESCSGGWGDGSSARHHVELG